MIVLSAYAEAINLLSLEIVTLLILLSCYPIIMHSLVSIFQYFIVLSLEPDIIYLSSVDIQIE